MDRLTDLESTCLHAILKDSADTYLNLRDFLPDDCVAKRTNTGSGFFVDLIFRSPIFAEVSKPLLESDQFLVFAGLGGKLGLILHIRSDHEALLEAYPAPLDELPDDYQLREFEIA